MKLYSVLPKTTEAQVVGKQVYVPELISKIEAGLQELEEAVVNRFNRTAHWNFYYEP